MIETKFKGNGEVLLCGVNGIIADVKGVERAKKWVAILLNDVWHSAVIDFICVSSRILWIKFRFSRIKVCMLVGYVPKEGNGEERERFWNGLDMIVDRVGNGYILCIMGDMNGWIGNRARAG